MNIFNLFRKKDCLQKALDITSEIDLIKSEINKEKRYYNEEKNSHSIRLSILTNKLSIIKSEEDIKTNTSVREKIEQRFRKFDIEYEKSVIEKTKQVYELKKSLSGLLKDKKTNDIYKSELEKQQIGSSYEVIKKLYSDEKLPKERFSKLRRNAEKKLKNQVSYADAIVCNNKDQVLLLKRNIQDDMFPGKWSLPGGHVDPNEDTEIAAIRELHEETLLEIPICTHVAKLDKPTALINYYKFYVIGTPTLVLNSREHETYEWVDITKLELYDVIGDLNKVFDDVFAYRKPEPIEIKKADFENDIEKGKKANIGEIRDWSGKKMKKVSNDKWEEVLEKKQKPEKKESEDKEWPTDYKLSPDHEYFVRYSGHIDEDLKRGWSSWGFGGGGFEGTKEEFDNYLDSATESSPVSISGFELFPDDIKNYEFGELYPGYWVAIDNVNAKGGLSAHQIPNDDLDEMGEDGTIEDVLDFIDENKEVFDGTGDGETFKAKEGRVVYSKGNMHIIEVGEIKKSEPNSLSKAEAAFTIITKAFEDDLVDEATFLKAQKVYADNAKNRSLKRVGNPWGSTGKETPEKDTKTASKDKQEVKGGDLEEHAKQASDQALETASKSGEEELRVAAKKELERRETEHKPDEEKEGETKDEKEEGGKKESKSILGESGDKILSTIEDILKNPKKDKKEEGGDILSSKKKVEELSDKYKDLMTEAMEDDFLNPQITEQFSKKQKEYSRYIQRIKEYFDDNDKEDHLKKAQSLLGLKSEKEIKDFFGDGEIIGINVEDEFVSVLLEDCFCQRGFKDNTVEMLEIILNPDLDKGQGKGSDIFYNQINSFKEKGYKKVIADAAKSDVYNGYYTWARLGYELPEKQQYDFESRLKVTKDKDLENVKSLPELMSFPKGREYWKEKGFGFKGEFDLSDNSKSMFILNKYMEEKKNARK